MDTCVSRLWPSVKPPEHGPATAAAAHYAWRELASHEPAAGSAYERERVADIMIVLEALLVDLSLPCTAGDERARALAGALTAWRASWDLARVQADLATLLGKPVRLPGTGSRPEAALMAACTSHLDDGLLPLLWHIEGLAAKIGGEYLRPASRAITAVSQAASQAWKEDRTEGPEAVSAALAWLLRPVSSAHACALMAQDAVPALRDGDQRAATVTNRWAYSRVRTDTLALLTSRHVGKTRRLIAGLSVEAR
jgi:hypothetical protein